MSRNVHVANTPLTLVPLWNGRFRVVRDDGAVIGFIHHAWAFKSLWSVFRQSGALLGHVKTRKAALDWLFALDEEQM